MADETQPAEVRLTDETIAFLEEKMRAAVSSGIKEAMTEEAAERFWTVGLKVLQQQATVKTGRFVLGGLATSLKKLVWISLIVALVYAVGGWTAVKAAWRLLIT